jgi:predicted acetyltransferase
MFDENNKPVSHIGVHEKIIISGDREYRIGGVAEVCVHPDYRGNGFVSTILTHVHQWMTGQDKSFSVLFGNPEVYSASGYVKAENIYTGKDGSFKQTPALVKCIREKSWPEGKVVLPGPLF